MLKQQGLLITILSVVLASSVFSRESTQGERWTRVEALESISSADTGVWRQQLQAELRSGDGHAALNSLRQLAQDPDLSAPAREKLLYEYVEVLRQEPPSSASKEPINFLQNYTSIVLVEDEDHPRGLVPLFNISSAAAGVQNEWRRQDATYRGAVQLALDPQNLVDAYLEAAGGPERTGLIDALSSANVQQLNAISDLAMEQIHTRPEAFTLAAKAALRNGNTRVLQQLVSGYEHPDMAHVLQDSARVLSPQQSSQLLEAALAGDSVLTASLAVAILNPVLAGDLQTETMLLEKLADEELGSTAAIALAQTASPQTLLELQKLARPSNHSSQASKARMALQVREVQLNPETGQ